MRVLLSMCGFPFGFPARGSHFFSSCDPFEALGSISALVVGFCSPRGSQDGFDLRVV